MHVNELILPGNDPWTNAFNSCSDHYIKAHDEKLSQEERDEHLEIWFQQRQCLEQGIGIY